MSQEQQDQFAKLIADLDQAAEAVKIPLRLCRAIFDASVLAGFNEEQALQFALMTWTQMSNEMLNGEAES